MPSKRRRRRVSRRSKRVQKGGILPLLALAIPALAAAGKAAAAGAISAGVGYGTKKAIDRIAKKRRR